MGPTPAGPTSWIQRHARRLRSLYFAGFGLAFLVTWVAPTAFGERTLRTLVFYIILEAMAILTSFALLIPWTDPDDGGAHNEGPAWVALVWVPLGVAAAFFTAREFGILWGMAPFVLSLASLAGDLVGAERGGPAVQGAKHRLVATFLVFMGAAAVMMLLPLPALGLTDAVVQRQGFEAMAITSDFFDEPETAMAWGGLYFLGLAAAEVHRLPARLAEWDES